jgi:hypothetical protein
MDNVIQQLKKNEKPLCLLSSEMQDFILGCETDDLEYLSSESGLKSPDWRTNANSSAEIKRAPIDTYRLRADYEDEPEIVEEIVHQYDNGGNYYYNRKNNRTITGCYPLATAISDPDFIGFKFESGQVEFSPIVFKSSVSTKSICQFRDLVDLEVLHATHVLFRQKTKE